jgi:hypothetical protein
MDGRRGDNGSEVYVVWTQPRISMVGIAHCKAWHG